MTIVTDFEVRLSLIEEGDGERNLPPDKEGKFLETSKTPVRNSRKAG